MTEPLRKAAIYTRISADPEGRELGIQRQEQDCRKLAERLSAQVVAVYPENDVSASTLSRKRRPLYEQMLAAAERGEFEMILAYSNSRLTRRPAEWNQLIEMHEQHGVEFHTVASGTADLSRADGRAVARTMAAWDGAEAERISERVKRAKLQAAEQGENNGGGKAYGWVDNVTIHPAEHAVVREFAERVLAGDSLRSIAKDMNARGVPTRTGVAWSPDVIKQILVSPRIAGWRTRYGEITARGVWDPLLDEATWQQVRTILTDPLRDTGGRGRVHLLTSLALCGLCDRPVGLQASSSRKRGPRKKYFCRDCNLYREVSLVDEHVTAYMVELLAGLEDLDDAEAESGSVAAAAAVQVRKLRERLKNNVISFADSDVMTDTEFETMQRRLRARLSAAEARLAVPKRRRLVLGLTGPEAADRWEAASLDRKRAVIDAFVEVRLYRGRPGSNAFDPASIKLTPR